MPILALLAACIESTPAPIDADTPDIDATTPNDATVDAVGDSPALLDGAGQVDSASMDTGNGADASAADATADAISNHHDASDTGTHDIDGGALDAASIDAAPDAPVCTPTLELCDSTDNDCDGVTDEMSSANPTPALCVNADLLRTCSNTFVSCAAQERTCVSGACGGVCRARDFQCIARDQSRECNTEGQWRATVTCDFDERCDDDTSSDSAGQCIDNPLLVVGRASTEGEAVPLSDGYVYAREVFVPWDASVEQVGLYTSTTSTRGQVEIGVYTDVAGEPRDLLFRSMRINLVRDSSNPIFLADLPSLEERVLEGPATYWIAAFVSAESSDGPEMLVDDSGESYRDGELGTDAHAEAMIPEGVTTLQSGDASLWLEIRRY